MFFKIAVLTISLILQENTLLESFFKKIAGLKSCYHIETSQLSCRANQLTGFYMMITLRPAVLLKRDSNAGAFQ